jgi:hypothetical protein
MNKCFMMHGLKKALLAGLAVAALSGATETLAAGYTSQSLNLPGPPNRMSNNGGIAGSYETRCTIINNQPKEVFCYYAPWYYDGAHVTKIQWPTNSVAYGFALNNTFEVVGSDNGLGWLYNGGNITYTSGSGAPTAVNNVAVALGTGTNVNLKKRPIRFTNGVGVEVGFNDPYLSASTTNVWGVDINDAGLITGFYQDVNNDYKSYVVDGAGTVTFIPTLGVSPMYCQPVRMSQANPTTGQVWIAGNCSGRAFIYEMTSGTFTELANIPGATNPTVKSINSKGTAVGTTILAGGVGTVVLWPAGSTSTTIPTDLNANNAIAPTGAQNLHPIDMDEAGDILVTYYTLPNVNIVYEMLHPIP